MKKECIERPTLAVVAFVLSFVAACSSHSTGDVQSRIAAVEKSLIPAVIATGSEPPGMSLTDRMQHFAETGNQTDLQRGTSVRELHSLSVEFDPPAIWSAMKGPVSSGNRHV